MIHSTPRRALMILAVVAAASARASAQGDGALASAFGQLSAPLAALAGAKTKPQQPAAPKAPSAPEAVWQKVIGVVKNEGKYKLETHGFASFALEDVTGDPKADHTTHGINFLGKLNDDDMFQAMNAALVSKVYTLDAKAGNWRIDMWLFRTDIYGQVSFAAHGAVVETLSGQTVSSLPEKLNPADPKIQAQYDAMVKHWAERKP